MPKEMLEQITTQYNAHIEVLQKLAERLMELTERVFDRSGDKDRDR